MITAGGFAAIIITTAVPRGHKGAGTISTKCVTAVVAGLRAAGRAGTTPLVYLSGAFSPAPGAPPLGCFPSCLVSLFNVKGMVLDNNAVQRFLATEAVEVPFTVVRMGMVGDAPSKGVLKAVPKNSGGKVTFTDVATLLLGLAFGGGHTRAFLFAQY